MVVPIMTDYVLGWKQHGNSMWTENVSSMVRILQCALVGHGYVLGGLVDRNVYLSALEGFKNLSFCL